ncbi:hypothetical protein CIPAW_08G000900 [Carya illinoinensis]|uniref:Uncharacterized protein n=1 Tax=Carya illinoinensis TaxID=32201 RepID=A0A8T1PQ75_CARIL|nr:hypothetical protein CIPAW_08G000900 [Carya illinoinensis]
MLPADVLKKTFKKLDHDVNIENFMCSRKKFQMWRRKKFKVMVIY